MLVVVAGEESGGWPDGFGEKGIGDGGIRSWSNIVVTGKLMNQIRKRNQLGKNSFIADVKARTDGDEDNKIQLNQATI